VIGITVPTAAFRNGDQKRGGGDLGHFLDAENAAGRKRRWKWSL
jgi:hypothetical protein